MNSKHKTETQLRDEMHTIDKRRRSAQAIAHALFDEIHHLISKDVASEVHHILIQSLHRNGVMVISDAEVAALGLEPKDMKGWTPSERLRLKFERDQAMMTAFAPFIPASGVKP